MDQKEIAQMLDLAPNTVLNYEKGKREPDSETLRKWANFTECDPGWLLTGTVPDHIAATGKMVGGGVEGEGDYLYVPKYDVQSGSGEGVVVHSEQIVDHLAFKQGWIRGEMGLDPKKLALITAAGDSMEPTIRPGDLLLLDLRVVTVKEDGIYCFSEEGELKTKRIQKVKTTLVIRSDNPVYKEYTLSGKEIASLNLIGRMVWAGRRF